MSETLKLVCAWCLTVLREGAEPASHGICAQCTAETFPEELALAAEKSGTPDRLSADFLPDFIPQFSLIPTHELRELRESAQRKTEGALP